MTAPSLPPLGPFHRRALLLVLVWAVAVRVLFALHDPGPGRFFDERYSFDNLHALLVAGSWRPANGWYGTLAHLPQAAVLAISDALARWTGRPALAVVESGRFTATAYLLCRFTVVVYGALTLLLTHRLGRRLASPAVALAATFLLAASPAHLRASVMFKPDMLMLLGVLVAFLLTLGILEPRTARLPGPLSRYRRDGLRFAGLGAAVGLTTASKLLGALSGLPLVLALTLPRRLLPVGRRPRGRLLVGGFLALLVAIGVFLAVNPYPGLHWHHLERNSAIYQERAELAGLTRGGALMESLGTLAGEGFHGPWIGPLLGALAALGSAGLLILALAGPAGRRSGTDRRAAFLLPTFVLAFVGVYTLATAYPKANNLLPALPFLTLAAAWLVVRGLQALGRLLEARDRGLPGRGLGGWAKAGLLLLLAGVLSTPTHMWAYRTVVPTTHQAVARFLEAELAPFVGRTVLWRGDGEPPRLVTRREAVAMVQDLTAVHDVAAAGPLSPDLRRRLDALVLPSTTSPSARQGSAVPGDPGIHRFSPSPGRLRGPALAVHLQPWRRVAHHRLWWQGPVTGESGEGGEPRSWHLEPPPTDPAQSTASADPWWSVQILWRDPQPPASPPVLHIEAPPAAREASTVVLEPLTATALETGGYHYGWAYTSLRFRPPAGAAVIVGLPAGEPRRTPVADVALWRP